MILKGEPHLGYGDHDYSPLPADPNHLANACVKVWDVFKNLKGSYEWKEFTWKLNPRRRHQQYLEVGFAFDMCAEVLQPLFFHIYADNLIKAGSDKLSNETVPTPYVQVSPTLRIAGNRVEPAERKVRKFLGGSRCMARCSAAKHWGVLNLHLSRQLLSGALGGTLLAQAMSS